MNYNPHNLKVGETVNLEEDLANSSQVNQEIILKAIKFLTELISTPK